MIDIGTLSSSGAFIVLPHVSGVTLKFSNNMNKKWIVVVEQSPSSVQLYATQVRSLGQEGPLEKEMATHSRILAWKIPWMEEPGGLQSMGHKESDTTQVT